MVRKKYNFHLWIIVLFECSPLFPILMLKVYYPRFAFVISFMYYESCVYLIFGIKWSLQHSLNNVLYTQINYLIILRIINYEKKTKQTVMVNNSTHIKMNNDLWPQDNCLFCWYLWSNSTIIKLISLWCGLIYGFHVFIVYLTIYVEHMKTQKSGTTTHDTGNPGPGLGQTQKMWRGIPIIPLLITGSPTAIYIYKQTNKKPGQIRCRSNRPHTVLCNLIKKRCVFYFVVMGDKLTSYNIPFLVISGNILLIFWSSNYLQDS